MYMEEMVTNNQERKTISLRMQNETDDILNRIKDKYSITKSEVVETLIKKYAKEEYGSF